MNGVTHFRLLVINNVLRNGKTNVQKWKHNVQENASVQGSAKFGGKTLAVRTGLVKVIRRMVFNYIFNASVFKKTLAISSFNSSHFTLPIIMSVFKFNFMNSFCEILNKIGKWPCPKPCVAIELLSARYVFFYIFTNSFNFFCIGNEKVMYFSVSSPNYVNCPSNSSEKFVENYGNFIRYFITIYSVQHPYIYLYNDNVPSFRNIFTFIIFIFKNLSTNVTELCTFI